MTRTPPTVVVPGKLRYRVLYGSHAHGTATPTSDEDWRGMFQVETDVILGLERAKETFEVKASDQVYWELAQFARLLLKGNPNLVGMLWAPEECVTEWSPLIAEIIGFRERLITEPMQRAYHGWVLREMKDLEKLHKIPAKRLSHVPRLLWELEGALLHKAIPVRLEGDRLATVMAIKTGEMSIEDAQAFCGSLMLQIEDLVARTPLPQAPFDLFNRIVLDARKGFYE